MLFDLFSYDSILYFPLCVWDIDNVTFLYVYLLLFRYEKHVIIGVALSVFLVVFIELELLPPYVFSKFDLFLVDKYPLL